jgi:ParB/RepB/Spo0J family partition protein
MKNAQKLEKISVDAIKENPDNPRIIFRQEELDSLSLSIKKFGVQVPISVYIDGSSYVLIDGERRWRTCKKLNFKEIPALINPKPNPLQNLLIMFNIHSLREQWDSFTIANKLTTVIELIKKRTGCVPNEIELSEETGLTRGAIRRCKMLIDLPERFKEMILEELKKPKAKQKFTEDFFIEMESALRTVKNNLSASVEDIDAVRDVLIDKFRNGVIENMVDFRKVAKIATAPKNVDYDPKEAQAALKEIFSPNDKSIDRIYNQTVAILYDEKKLVVNFSHILMYIRKLTSEEKRDKEIIDVLAEIKSAIEAVLNEG